MKILVSFKVVPQWDRILEEDWAHFTPNSDIAYAGAGFNCFDESALELGLRIKDSLAVRGETASCTAVSLGRTLSGQLVQSLYAAGYDRVILLKGENLEFCPQAVAKELSAFARDEDYDLILTGAAAGMADTGTVPALLAAELGLPFLPECGDISAGTGDEISATVQGVQGLWKCTAKLPLAVSVGNSSAMLRAVSLKTRLAASGKACEIIETRALAQNVVSPVLHRPDSDRSCKMLDGGPGEVLELISAGKEESEQRSAVGGGFPPKTVAFFWPEREQWNLSGLFEELLQCCRREKPQLTMLPNTAAGRALAARLALEEGLPCFIGGEIRGEIVLRTVCASNLVLEEPFHLPAVITVAAPPPGTSVTELLPKNSSDRISARLETPQSPGKLTTAPLVILCGLGMGSPEACSKARELAKMLGAGFGLTRPAALNGWGDAREIVGQSGCELDPKACLVLGASGAAAFLAGFASAEKIIAVNKNPDALIFRRADYGICSDAPTFVSKLIEVLKGGTAHEAKVY